MKVLILLNCFLPVLPIKNAPQKVPDLWGAYQNFVEFYFKYLCTGENSPTITLRTLTEAAFQCDCFACHVLKVR